VEIEALRTSVLDEYSQRYRTDQHHLWRQEVSRQEILDQIKQAYGFVPGFFAEAPDVVLEGWWTQAGWLQSETALPARDKALVAFGAAAATHCEY
jgi:alkylhydroperoxidase/carboxymuconolactone decarboxylase family protein YurZ